MQQEDHACFDLFGICAFFDLVSLNCCLLLPPAPIVTSFLSSARTSEPDRSNHQPPVL